MEGRRSEIMLKERMERGLGGGGVHGKSIPTRTSAADVIAGLIELTVDKCFPINSNTYVHSTSNGELSL